jgi:hypothetical protein
VFLKGMAFRPCVSAFNEFGFSRWGALQPRAFP